LFVAHDSADVWSHQQSFQLDASGQPTHVSGVPPDYFSATGQRWGMPLYRWEVLASDAYEFWVQRLGTLLERFDLVRLDHFIGFVRYWQIPAEEETAIKGRWLKGPGAALFDTLQTKFESCARENGSPGLPFIAEDLGSVNEEVRALCDRFGVPGMRVLQFGFGTANEHLPHCYPARCIAYTGTHDTHTIMGFLKETAGRASTRTARQVEDERRRALAYANGPHAPDRWQDAHLALIRVLFASVAQTVIIPLQDWLGQGEEARMNTPGQTEGNWGYRVQVDQLSDALAMQMRAYVETYQRLWPASTVGSAKSP
jgi:4-alpha-glucanotransferase